MLKKPPQPKVIIDLNGHGSSDPPCWDYILKWARYFDQLGPTVALLIVPGLRQSYFDIVNAKTRNMVRKARKLEYMPLRFNYNDYLKEMHEINTSALERQGRPMSGSYFEKLAPIGESSGCKLHEQIYCGVFNGEGKLVAYCWLARCGDVAIINRILGHAYYLKDGIMNLLIDAIVLHAHAQDIEYINYRTMESTTEGLEKFKKHVGFKPVRIEVIR